MTVTLLMGGSAFGQFMIQPMKVTVQAAPGRRTPVQVVVENNGRTRVQQVDVRIVDMTQDKNGNWQAIEPDAKRTTDPNGTVWVTVPTDDGGSMRLDVTKLRSCQSWLRLLQDTVSIPPVQRMPVQLFLDVPGGTRGYYCAALLARSSIGTEDIEGFSTELAIEFLVPIFVEIQGRPVRHEIDLTGAGLELLRSGSGQTAAVVALKVKNDGGTYSKLRAYARIWRKFGGRYRKLTDVDFGEGSIIPGVEFTMRADAGLPLPAGEYKVQGYLIVDDARGAQITEELTFAGDPRVRNVRPGASLDMDPRELFITTIPGQTRPQSLWVANASDDAVQVEATVSLPEHMLSTGAGSIRGDQFECANWLEVSPSQFTLEGGQRMNLRVLSTMPVSATGANYYAMVRLHAKYPDGQEAGRADCRVCISNTSTPKNAMITPFPVTLAELSPGRFAVKAKFLNAGDTHVQPVCRARLNNAITGDMLKEFNLESDVLNDSGILLPLESRIFQGILETAGISPGLYRLTAILSYGREAGDVVLQQAGLEVADSPSGKTVTLISTTGLPPEPVPVKLQ